MDLHIHIGSEDTDVSSSVNQSKGANNQGLNRFQRANNFFGYTTKIVEENDLNYNWSFLVVDGVDHSNSRMSKAAAKVIFVN